MTANYTTCALFMENNVGTSLNPFTLAEYEAHCGKSGSSSNKVPVISVCAVSSTSVGADVQKAIEDKCKTNSAGGFVLDDACVQALRSVPDMAGHRDRSATDPLFTEADVCRTKLNGHFRVMCGAQEVTYDELRSSIGANCDECCETIVDKAEAKLDKSHDKAHGKSHAKKNASTADKSHNDNHPHQPSHPKHSRLHHFSPFAL